MSWLNSKTRFFFASEQLESPWLAWLTMWSRRRLTGTIIGLCIKSEKTWARLSFFFFQFLADLVDVFQHTYIYHLEVMNNSFKTPRLPVAITWNKTTRSFLALPWHARCLLWHHPNKQPAEGTSLDETSVIKSVEHFSSSQLGRLVSKTHCTNNFY